jgi:hypothetical protein
MVGHENVGHAVHNSHFLVKLGFCSEGLVPSKSHQDAQHLIAGLHIVSNAFLAFR